MDGWVTRTRIKDSLGEAGVYVPRFAEVFSPPFSTVRACEWNGGIWVQALSGHGLICVRCGIVSMDLPFAKMAKKEEQHNKVRTHILKTTQPSIHRMGCIICPFLQENQT